MIINFLIIIQEITMKILTLSVAAYNIENYIENMIEKICDCDFLNELEVLIIDDGATDQTGEIAKKYNRRFPDTFQFIHKENGGWGSTVNTGIAYATGKYFKLLDGDDYITGEELNAFIKYLKNIETDMVYTEFRSFDDSSNNTIKQFTIPCNLERGISYYLENVAQYIYPRMHSIAFKSELLKKNNVEITEHCFYTDVEYVMKSLQYVKTISFFEGNTYNYRIARQGQSVSVEGLKKHYNDHVQMTLRMLELYKKLKVTDSIKTLYIRRIKDLIEAQYIIFWKVGSILKKEYYLFDSELYLYPEFYKKCSKQVKVSRIFYKLKMYRIFIVLFNKIKPDANI